ncbi:MAG: hypothetical protein ACUVTN_05280 [Thermodesulfobacteriota bacterium]
MVYPIFAGMILAQFVMLGVGLGGMRFFASIINIDRRIMTPIIFPWVLASLMWGYR